MADQTTFSRSIHFTGLDADPNMPQPLTLLREIEDDPTVAAADITIVGDRIDLAATESDVAVSMTFRDTGGQLDWGDIGSTEQAAILAVLAAHEGKVTTDETQAVYEAAESVITGGWEDKLTITTPPLVAGKFRVEATCEHYLGGTPTIGTDFSGVRLWIDSESRAVDFNGFDKESWAIMLATEGVKEGETITAALQARRTGTVNAGVRRARLTVRKIDNETEL